MIGIQPVWTKADLFPVTDQFSRVKVYAIIALNKGF